LLYLLTRLSAAPFAMQLVHVGIATLSAFVVLRFAPFPFAWRVLYVFGYFPFFEYATISRMYALGGLLLALACLARDRGRPWLAAGCLALAAQTSVFGSILALAFAAAALGPRLAIAVVAAVALAAWQMVPPPDSSFAARWFLGFDWPRLVGAATVPARALLPIPQPIEAFWNTNLLERWPHLLASAAIPIVVAPAWCWRRQPTALAFWLLAASGLLAFHYVKLIGQPRHHGHFFLALAAAGWLAARRRPAEPAGWARALVPLWLGCHAVLGFAANAADWRLPFSASADVVRFLKAKGLDGLPIAGDIDSEAAPFAALLGRPVYYPSIRRAGTFVVWNGERTRQPVMEAVDRVDADLGGENPRVIVLLNRRLPARRDGLIEIARFERAIVPTERYRVYVLDQARKTRPGNADVRRPAS